MAIRFLASHTPWPAGAARIRAPGVFATPSRALLRPLPTAFLATLPATLIFPTARSFHRSLAAPTRRTAAGTAGTCISPSPGRLPLLGRAAASRTNTFHASVARPTLGLPASRRSATSSRCHASIVVLSIGAGFTRLLDGLAILSFTSVSIILTGCLDTLRFSTLTPSFPLRRTPATADGEFGHRSLRIAHRYFRTHLRHMIRRLARSSRRLARSS